MIDVSKDGLVVKFVNNKSKDMVLLEDHYIAGFKIPKGFIFDGASCIDETNDIRCASLIHDFLYRNIHHNYSRKEVDNIFLNCMKEYGVGYTTRKKIYLGVRVGGVDRWNNIRGIEPALFGPGRRKK